MNPVITSPDELIQAGLHALVRELGPVGMMRFIQHFEPGKGDYTAERHEWLTEDISEIVAKIRQSRANHD